MFEGINELPPGTFALIGPGDREVRPIRYWRDGDEFERDLYPKDIARGPAGLERALSDSVSRHLVADVPLGTYNSGGVDSSVISELAPVIVGDLHTFSVGFAELSHDESRHAESAARTNSRSIHHKLVIGADDYADDLPKTIWHLDEPLHHAHTVQLMRLSKFAKRYVTVVLTGEGADELFGGYPRYQIPLLARRIQRLPRILLRGSLALAAATGQRRIAKLLEVAHDHRRALIDNARFASESKLTAIVEGDTTGNFVVYADEDNNLKADDLERILYYDRMSYLPSLLQRLDRTTMADGLEARVPYLDHHLLAWSKTLQASQKVVLGRHNKVLLKKYAAGIFPREIIYRRKMGFDVPVGKWLRDDRTLGRYLNLITDTTFAQRGICRTGR